MDKFSGHPATILQGMDVEYELADVKEPLNNPAEGQRGCSEAPYHQDAGEAIKYYSHTLA